MMSIMLSVYIYTKLGLEKDPISRTFTTACTKNMMQHFPYFTEDQKSNCKNNCLIHVGLKPHLLTSP